jgi:hypothetical protein
MGSIFSTNARHISNTGISSQREPRSATHGGSALLSHAASRQNVFHLPRFQMLGSQTRSSFEEHHILHVHQGHHRASLTERTHGYICTSLASHMHAQILSHTTPQHHYVLSPGLLTCMVCDHRLFVFFQWFCLAVTC